MNRIIGIDPGVTGGIAILEGDILLAVAQLPTRARLHGSGQQIDGAALMSWIVEHRQGQQVLAILEAVASRPGQGARSIFNFGHCLGTIEGVLSALGVPYRLVSPPVWKKRAGLTGKDKSASRSLAMQLYPDHADHFKRVRDDGLAEAVLLAKFGQEVLK
jgi:crossover junction endodeoxyribonuclease RuvC